MNIIFASNNNGKIVEIKEIFSEYDVISLKEIGIKADIIEDGTTFKENSIKKAVEVYNLVYDRFDKRIPVIADDSGIIVESLVNWPGIMTHRFLGDGKTDSEINQAIINKVNTECTYKRDAKFVCALAYYDGKNIVTQQANIKGKITEKERGNNGFGFDTIFEVIGVESGEKLEYAGKTLAELTSEEKNKISARKHAAKRLREKIKNVKDI